MSELSGPIKDLSISSVTRLASESGTATSGREIMKESFTCGCGAVFEDKEMIEMCIERDHDLELEEFECRCGQVYDNPEAVDLCTNEGHLF